jgi:hypothetical protein
VELIRHIIAYAIGGTFVAIGATLLYWFTNPE